MKFEKINDIMLLIVTLFNFADSVCKIRKKVKMNELENLNNVDIDNLYNDVSNMIEKAKEQVAIHVNTELVVLNWNIGNRIDRKSVV